MTIDASAGNRDVFDVNANSQFTINPVVAASVTIASDDADNIICAGSSVTFTATPSAGVSSPLYQWQVNGVNVGSNSSTNTFTIPTNSTSSIYNLQY